MNARSCGSARMLRSNLAPSIRFPERSAKSSKNFVSRGIRRMSTFRPVTTCPIQKQVNAGSRVISHAQRGVSKPSRLPIGTAGDQNRRAARYAQSQEAEQEKYRRRTDGHRLQKSGEQLSKIHFVIMGAFGRRREITDRLEPACESNWLQRTAHREGHPLSGFGSASSVSGSSGPEYRRRFDERRGSFCHPLRWKRE